MKKVLTAVVVLMAVFLFIVPSYADQVIYEPGPADGMDVWLSSYYDYGDDYGVDDWKLQAGGWGDEYRFLIQFDLTNLPQNPTSAVMWMLPYDRGDSSTSVGLNVDRVTGYWDESTGWYNQPAGVGVGSLPAPNPDYWYGINITNIYNAWKVGTYPNYGFKFLPVSNNNEYSQFFSSDLPSDYHDMRPKLVVTYDGANLAFPLTGYTPYNVPISGVVDHAVTTGFNCPDNIVVAYTGETGEAQYGVSSWSTAATGSTCLGQSLWGFAQNNMTPFSINGQYDSPDANGDDLFLFYDGHTGYDYPVYNTDTYAASTGVAYAYDGGDIPGMMIVHTSGYITYYLHLPIRLIEKGQPSQPVSKGSWIGQTGTQDLHFTVKNADGVRVDPYGWKGEWGTDPLQIDGADNICLWENCEWW